MRILAVRGKNLVSRRVQVIHRRNDVGVSMHPNPLSRPARCPVVDVQPTFGRHHVGLEYAGCVAVSQDGGEVVRLVDLLHEDGQVRLTTIQGRPQSVEALGSHAV